MEESFPMNGGDGAYSYTKNSRYLVKQASDTAKGMIQDAIIENLEVEILLSISDTLGIADFGCSVGPNTFFTVQNLIEAVENKCSSRSLDRKNMELRVFFNDHTANDFNRLFASLPPERKYLAARVPGSFYGRLFPRASLGLAHSSYALQWLSKAPESKSPAWNQGRIHYVGASRDVVIAYSDQFKRDFGIFLSARAEEIVSGGLMFLIMRGIPEGVCHSQLPAAILFNFLESSIIDLAKETVGEMRKLIEKNCCISIQTVELTNPRSQMNGPIDAYSLVMRLRAGMEGISSKHFGNSVADEMFSKTVAKTEEISRCLEAGYPDSTLLFVVLKRK